MKTIIQLENNMEIKNFAPRPFHFSEITPKIESNLKYTKNVTIDDYQSGYIGTYWTFDFIKFIADYVNFDDIKTIFDIGTRDCLQSLELHKFFPDAKIWAFEGCPDLMPLCAANAAKGDGKIIFVPNACSDINGEITFNVVSGNIGASSILKTTNVGRAAEWPQTETKTEAIRLDTFCDNNNLDGVDMLWMDVQGAEKFVFDGMGEKLKNVKIINTECNLQNLYHGSIMAHELDEYMNKLGFTNLITYYLDTPLTPEEIKARTDEVEIIYINNNYLKV